MTRRLTRFGKTFYTRRHLPKPRAEYRPQDCDEVAELLCERDLSVPMVILGGGLHVRPTTIGERAFDVIRMDRLSRVLSLDRESLLLRVEAGMSWKSFATEVATRELSVGGYDLFPSGATIGGLLARRHAVHRGFHDGDIRGRCVALRAISPAKGEYDYLPAPRKSSGPDLRYLFVGAEGLYGAILDATMALRGKEDTTVIGLHAESLRDAAVHYTQIYDLGIRPQWTRWSTDDNTLWLGFYGTDRYLTAVDKRINDVFPVMSTLQGQEAVTLRQSLEDEHPDRRDGPDAQALRRIDLSMEVAAQLQPEMAETWMDVRYWTRHKVCVFARELTPSDEVIESCLSYQHVLDEEPVHWPHWAQALKRQLDPERRLGMGP